jgi:hypothetical protein
MIDPGLWTPLAYALMVLILVGGGAFAVSRRAKAAGARGPGALVSLLIWLTLIALIAVLYFGAQFWSALLSMVS